MDAKKKCLVASETLSARVVGLRQTWREWQRTVDPERLVFIDEAGSTIAMTRTHGRAPAGERVSDNVPRNRGNVTSMLGGLTLRGGLEAMMTIEGGTDGDVFVAFLDEILGPVLRNGDLVVMDNAGAHKDPRVRTTLEKYGAKPVYLPPYSPEFNPIEHAWFVLKDYLRSAKPRDVDALNLAIRTGMRLVTPAMARALVRHCGYVAQLN